MTASGQKRKGVDSLLYCDGWNAAELAHLHVWQSTDHALFLGSSHGSVPQQAADCVVFTGASQCGPSLRADAARQLLKYSSDSSARPERATLSCQKWPGWIIEGSCDTLRLSVQIWVWGFCKTHLKRARVSCSPNRSVLSFHRLCLHYCVISVHVIVQFRSQSAPQGSKSNG